MAKYDKMRILLIEDEAYTRNIIKSLLHQIGLRSITEAADGGQGFNALLYSRPHLVFCDVHMEPENGLQFLVKVRESKLDWVQATKVIFLTADSQSDTVLFAKDHKVDGYMVKPVSLNSLKGRIDQFLAANPNLS